MKSIGIPSLKKTTKKEVISKSRHEHEIPSNEPEGQLSVDVHQTHDEIIIIAPIAGANSEDIHLSITDDILTIKGRRQKPLMEKLETSTPYTQECFWGRFSRTIILSAEVDSKNVVARFKNNVLTVRVPKTEHCRTRVIQINDEQHS